MSQTPTRGLKMSKSGTEQKLYILRCCRDWPVDLVTGTLNRGFCGLCNQEPQFVFEEYDSAHDFGGDAA